MKLFELFATLSLDTSDFDDGVSSARQSVGSLESSTDSMMANAKTMGKAVFDAVSAAGNALWSLGKTAVETAAEVQAENEQYAATFAGVEESAAAAFASVAEQTGIVAARLRGVGMQAFSQFKGAGMDSALAMDTMAQHMNLAADAAAYYNISFEDADARLRSFLRGNTEAGDAIGLFTSEMQRNDRALAMYNKKWQDLNEQQRQLVMLDIADEIYRSSGAFGQAGREAESYGNAIANFEATWRQTVAKLGGPLLDHVIPVLQRLTAWFDENPEKAEALGESIGKVAGFLADSLIAAFEWITDHSDEIISFLQGVADFIALIFSPMKSAEELRADYDAKFDKRITSLTGDQIAAYNTWAEKQLAAKAAEKALEDAWLNNPDGPEVKSLTEAYEAAQRAAADAMKAAQEQYGMEGWNTYTSWLSSQTGHSLENPLLISPASGASLQGELNGHNFTISVTPTLNLGGVVSGLSGWLGTLGAPHATGLDYVPYNDYAARLHEGEAVLTKAEAEAWRRGGTPAPGIDYGLMADAMLTAFAGVSLQMDSQVVGGLVSPTVSRRIARETRKRRYTTT